MIVYLSVCVILLLYDRHRRGATAKVPALSAEPISAAVTLASPVPADAPLVTLADAAVAYERAVLELDDVAEATKTRALEGLAAVIVPLVGKLSLADLTPELEVGVATVLAVEATSSEQWIVCVWNDLVRWSRHHFSINQRC